MSSTRPEEPRRRASTRERGARIAVWMLWIGVAPLACELTTDLDKLRGPMGGGSAATGGAGGGAGGRGQGAGATGGGQAGGGGGGAGATIRIAYASADDVAALTYHGVCNESLWKKTHPIEWHLSKPSITATCRLAWGPTKGETNARTIYGCCEVDEPSLNPKHVAADCQPFQDDGIEYLIANNAGMRTDTTLSAWGASCVNAVVTHDINHTQTNFTPSTLNCFTPVGGAESCSQTVESGVKGFVLEWALPLDDFFSTDQSNVLCALGLRSKLVPTTMKYGQLTSSGGSNMYDPSEWGACTFEPPP